MLRSALEAKFRSDIVQHSLLFTDAANSGTDMFLSTLRELQLQSHDQGIDALHYHLRQLLQLEGECTTTENVISAYRKADPQIPERVARTHLAGLLELPAGVSDYMSVQLDKLIPVLISSWLPRFSPVADNFLKVYTEPGPGPSDYVGADVHGTSQVDAQTSHGRNE